MNPLAAASSHSQVLSSTVSLHLLKSSVFILGPHLCHPAALSTFSASEGIGILQWCVSWGVMGPHLVWQKVLLGEWLGLEAQGLVNRTGDDQEAE